MTALQSRGLVLDFQPLHEWPADRNEAVLIQRKLSSKIDCTGRLDHVRAITAIDTAYDAEVNRVFCTAVTMSYPELKDIERVVADAEISFPYFPSLLIFREGPVVLKTLMRLKNPTDLLIIAAHGRAHPLKIGMASHIGLITGLPTIGCARKILTGEYVLPSLKKGSQTPIKIGGETVGIVLRTKDSVKPMFVSTGHKCCLEDAVELILNCVTEYRMPEPLRMAHLYSGKFRKSFLRKKKK